MRRRCRKWPGRMELASTDHHNLIFDEAGDIVRHGTLAEYSEDPHFLASSKQRAASVSLEAGRTSGLGDERRSERLHRLQCLRRRLPG